MRRARCSAHNVSFAGIIVAHKRKYGIGELLNMRLLSNVHPMDLKFSEDAPGKSAPFLLLNSL